MENYDYDKTAGDYVESSALQKNASYFLLDTLKIRGSDNILDIGCGVGNITSKIRELTNGLVVGVDPSVKMLDQAKLNNVNIDYAHITAEEINYSDKFDIIFSNSAFHWFKNPSVVVENCFKALKNDGKIGIQCPATSGFCTLFQEIQVEIKNDIELNSFFKNYNSPWFFFENINEYNSLFTEAGFKILSSQIIEVKQQLSVQLVFNYFRDTASPAYLNQHNYSVKITEKYIEQFLNKVESIIEKINSNGHLELDIKRLYLVAQKNTI